MTGFRRSLAPSLIVLILLGACVAPQGTGRSMHRTQSGSPALSEAQAQKVRFGTLDETRQLVNRRNVTLQCQDRTNNYPVELAAMAKIQGAEKLRYMQGLGVDLKSWRDPLSYATLLGNATLQGDVDTMRFLIDEVGLPVDSRDRWDRTPLFTAARYGIKPGAGSVRFLLDRGADPNARDNKGNTPLHYMASKDYYWGNEIAKLEELLSRGADPSLPNKHGQRPLDVIRNTQAKPRYQPAQQKLAARLEGAGGVTPLATARPATGTRPSSETRPQGLPPVLSISAIRFSEKVLDAEEKATLAVTLNNIGPGDAKNLYIKLQASDPRVVVPDRFEVPDVAKNGGTRTVRIPVEGGFELGNGRANIVLQLVEPNFNVRIKGKQLSFDTREFRKPKLILAKFAVLEQTSANPNRMIDVNEIIDVKFTVQNVGVGDAENLRLSLESDQPGLIPLGIVKGERVEKQAVTLPQLAAGKYETVTCRYFVNSDLREKNLHFTIDVREGRQKFGFRQEKQVAINTSLKEEGEIRIVRTDNPDRATEVTVEDVPDFVADVDAGLAPGKMRNPDAIAVVIGNRDYRNAKRVDFAINDATSIKRYLIDLLGYQEGNIFFLKNASKSDFETYFGTAGNATGKLYNAIKPGRSDVFVYYSGHGAPGLKDQQGYFVPVEADPQYLEINGYPAPVLFANLDRLPARSVTVVLDACFSGASVYENISSIGLNLKQPLSGLKHGVVLASSRGSQVSSWHNQKQHGLFTYFFLKAIRDGHADVNHDGRLTVGEIYDYVADKSEGVPYFARRLHGLEQNPTLVGTSGERPLVVY